MNNFDKAKQNILSIIGSNKQIYDVSIIILYFYSYLYIDVIK